MNCSACPNNQDGICEARDKVAEYDSAVLERCGLKAGQVLDFAAFTKTVQEKILATDKRREICGNCQWKVSVRNRRAGGHKENEHI